MVNSVLTMPKLLNISMSSSPALPLIWLINCQNVMVCFLSTCPDFKTIMVPSSTILSNYVWALLLRNSLKKSYVVWMLPKSTSLDNIPARFLKDSASILKIPITHIVNLSIMTSTVPIDFKIAKVKPLFKKNKQTDMGNYRPRPVSILNTVAEFKSFVMNNKAFGDLFCNSQKSFHTSLRSSDSKNRGYQSFFKLNNGICIYKKS